MRRRRNVRRRINDSKNRQGRSIFPRLNATRRTYLKTTCTVGECWERLTADKSGKKFPERGPFEVKRENVGIEIFPLQIYGPDRRRDRITESYSINEMCQRRQENHSDSI